VSTPTNNDSYVVLAAQHTSAASSSEHHQARKTRAAVAASVEEQLETVEAQIVRGPKVEGSGQVALLMNLRFIGRQVAYEREEEEEKKKRIRTMTEGKLIEGCAGGQAAGFVKRLDSWFGSREAVGSSSGRKPRIVRHLFIFSGDAGRLICFDRTSGIH
jgi:hypothetical protein